MNNNQYSRVVFWSVFALAIIILNIYCLRINLNADSLFPYRYIAALFSDNKNLIIIQPGSRIFPEWLYSALAYQLTTESMAWSRIVIFFNALLLGLSFLYLFKKLGFDQQKTLLFTVVGLLIIPIQNLLHLNVLIYFIFSPGLHGFFMPYLIFCLALFIGWHAQVKTSKLSVVVFIVISGLLIASNLNFMLALLIPLSILILILMAFKQMKPQLGLKLYIIILVSIVLGVLLAKALQLIPGLKFLQNHFNFFEVSFSDWLKNNELMNKMRTRKIVGYIFEIFVISQLLSIYSIYHFVNRKQSGGDKLVLLNIIHLIWPPLIIVALWVINKQSIRLMPYILIFSPLLLVINTVQVFKKQLNTVYLLLLILLLSIISTYVFMDTNRPYIQHNNIDETLLGLQESNQIKGVGLSDYWISNAIFHKDLELLPIDTLGKALIFAMDAKAFWHQGEVNINNEKFIDFIVNRKKIKANKWVLNEKALNKMFGQWDNYIDKNIDNKSYRIYLYTNGIDKKSFYDNLNTQLKVMTLN